jgi:hypothetical protein
MESEPDVKNIFSLSDMALLLLPIITFAMILLVESPVISNGLPIRCVIYIITGPALSEFQHLASLPTVVNAVIPNGRNNSEHMLFAG